MGLKALLMCFSSGFYFIEVKTYYCTLYVSLIYALFLPTMAENGCVMDFQALITCFKRNNETNYRVINKHK